MTSAISKTAQALNPVAILGNLTKTPKMPTASAPTVMPTRDDKAVKDAERRKLASLTSKSGRSNAMLTKTQADTKGNAMTTPGVNTTMGGN